MNRMYELALNELERTLTAAEERIKELETLARAVLSWWPEGSEALYEGRYGNGFADDIRALRAALQEEG